MKQKIKQDECFNKFIHELKTPTIAQIAALESLILTCDKNFSSDEKDLMELTLSSCRYTYSLIDAYTMINKENKMPIQEKFDIVFEFLEIIKKFQIFIKYYKLDFKLNSPKEIIINASKEEIIRVIENILSISINNALNKSMIEISILKSKNELIFKVRNKSMYLDDATIEDILTKPIDKISSSIKYNICLGLYLSKEIIEAQKGRMIIESYCDNTNLFGFSLPI